MGLAKIHTFASFC